MVSRPRSDVSDRGNPHVRSARMNGAWLILNIRREAFSFPRAFHVIAEISADDKTDTAIHAVVKLETSQKKRLVRFQVDDTDGIEIEPIVPVPETNSGPPLDGDELPVTMTVELTIQDIDSDREYDTVTVFIEQVDGTHEVKK